MQSPIKNVFLVGFLFFLLKPSILLCQEKIYSNSFSLENIKLLDGPLKHAQDLNIETLLAYDTDRLLAPFLKEAKLTPKGESFENWIGLDGHVGGHYLSALAIHYAASGKKELKQRMNYIVEELEKCQLQNSKVNPEWGKGYVGGVPESDKIWSGVKQGNVEIVWDSWVPWYNIHKTYAGLRDAWIYGGNEKAKTMFLKLCDWGIELTKDLSNQQMEAMLANEYGGMNEVYADAYEITGENKYLKAAKRFSQKELLNPLLEGEDPLDNLHANTQIPKAIGFQRIGELSGDENYLEAGEFFWEQVSGERSIALGGNSTKEHFPPASNTIDYIHAVEGPESCNTYNMLKLSQALFRHKPEARYVDFYERGLFNHILSTQHPDHGGYVYFTPARPQHYRVYSQPNSAMWCCVGSGMENHGKYGEFIYTHSNNDLWLNLFVASELDWEKQGLKIRQETDFPKAEKSVLKILEGNNNFSLNIRYPYWVKEGEFKISVNGEEYPINQKPSSYIKISRTWKKGDEVEIHFPMHPRLEELPHQPEYIAFMQGPILLGAETGTDNLSGLIAGNGRWEHIAGGERYPINEAPVILESKQKTILKGLQKVEGKPLNLRFGDVDIDNSLENLQLKPFYEIHDARYMMYWWNLSAEKYEKVQDSMAREEQKRMVLESRTLDGVSPGEQQPEADHAMENSKSSSGNFRNEFWRNASEGGFFSYELNSQQEEDLSLFVRVWIDEDAKTGGIIYIDNKELTKIKLDEFEGPGFRDIEYEIPGNIIQHKEFIVLKITGEDKNSSLRFFDIRLLKKE